MHILCYIPDGKVLAHLGFESNVLLRTLTDLSARICFGTSCPQQGVKFQIPDGQVLAHLGFESKVFTGPLTD
jgi:hypothetical protein